MLLVAVVALSVASYLEVRRSALLVAKDRLTALTGQLRGMLEQQAATLRQQLQTLAGAEPILGFVDGRNLQARSRALTALSEGAPQSSAVVATELRDGDGRVLLTTATRVSVDSIAARGVLLFLRDIDSSATGGVRAFGDAVIYPAAVRVPGTAEAYVVQWRRIGGTRRAREQLSQLIGSDASVLIGDPTGSWTDFERPVPAPAIDFSRLGSVQTHERQRDQSVHLIVAERVPGTPWVVAVDFPMANIMAPVETFVRRTMLIASIALLLGLIAAWILSRRITGALRDLTGAASALAAGEYSTPVRVRRSDELGQLAKAFAIMAGEVKHSREDLELRVEARTGELNQALQQLQDAQETLVRKERLAILGQLSSGVGHELRNPLGVMTNAVYYLRMVLPDAPTNVHEYLGILQQQITLSEKIVGDLLDFARSKPPIRKPTSIRQVVVEQLNRLGATNGVRIETAVPDELPPALVDRVQLGQIVLNLLTNAVQAIEGEGSVRVTADANAHRVTLEVADTGGGIARENLERIFEPLFTTKARGIGLGLAVSRTLARSNGGDLTAVSAPRQGARFRLTLPISDSKETP